MLRNVVNILLFLSVFVFGLTQSFAKDTNKQVEPVKACVSEQLVPVLVKKLQWISDGKRQCGGFYKSQKISKVSGFQLSANDASLALDGRSTVSGNVVMQQEDKFLSADLAHIYRKNGKVERVELVGDLVFEEPDHRLAATHAIFDVQNYAGRLDHVIYRLFLHSDNVEQQSVGSVLTAWGQACYVSRDKHGNLALQNVTYSTCPPTSVTWYLKAKELALNKKSSQGVARNATLYVKGKPLLYVPYISFPLDNKRKSGFLASDLAFTSQNGLDYRLPYYLNIAPNLDATLYPHYFSRRGLMYGGELRYLYGLGQGEFEAHYLPNDRAFRQFKQSNLWIAPQLARLSNKRYGMKWLNSTMLSDQLAINIDYGKVSDDYYLQDFNNNLVQAVDNQLLQQLSASFKTAHWVFHAIVQRYQTLHPFNQSVVNDVYARLPSLSALGEYYDLPYDFFVKFYTQLDRFVWQAPNWQTLPQGYRYHVAPTIGINYERDGYFIKPEVILHNTFYDLSHYNQRNENITRVIPLFSYDSGLFFEKDLIHGWSQTLEPRFYYLYVPYVRQSMVPIFDTSNFFSSYNQLFRPNRFAGLDRVGDANQFSLGLSTRFIDDNTGVERVRLSVGGAYKFKRERVYLCQNLTGNVCLDNANRVGFVSPDAGLAPVQLEAELKLTPKLSMLNNVAFSLSQKNINNAMMNFHFEPKKNHIINAGYGFLLHGDPTLLTNRVRTNTNLHQFRISYAWAYNDHWRAMGAWNYNISHQFSMSYLLGLQYDDCCVAFRLLGGRVYRFYNPQGSPTYGNNVYLQVLLKGLGSAANNDPGGVISNFLPTFRDEFKTR